MLIFFLITESKTMANDLVDIHGFISQGYLKTDNNNYLADTKDGSTQFNEMGINFRTSPTDKLTIGCQFFARDLGAVGNDEVTLGWVVGDSVVGFCVGEKLGNCEGKSVDGFNVGTFVG